MLTSRYLLWLSGPLILWSLLRMKYIETELKKRKGIVEQEEQKAKPKNAEDCLYELPENIRVSSAKKTEEMLSNQMLSGIPEVDLGIEYVSQPWLCPVLGKSHQLSS